MRAQRSASPRVAGGGGCRRAAMPGAWREPEPAAQQPSAEGWWRGKVLGLVSYPSTTLRVVPLPITDGEAQ
jgi:hypothetical protein